MGHRKVFFFRRIGQILYGCSDTQIFGLNIWWIGERSLVGKVTEINGLFLMTIKYLNENLSTFIEFNGELEIVAMAGYS